MTQINELRQQVENVRKRLGQLDGQDSDQVGEIKERLSSIKSELLRKQQIIEEQQREIETLREENRQLSEILTQALSALDEQAKVGVHEVVQELDAEISDLLSKVASAPADDEDAAGSAPLDASNGTGETGAASAAEPAQPERGGDGQAQTDNASDGPHTPTGEGERRWDPESESPALRRIMGRSRRRQAAGAD